MVNKIVKVDRILSSRPKPQSGGGGYRVRYSQPPRQFHDSQFYRAHSGRQYPSGGEPLFLKACKVAFSTGPWRHNSSRRAHLLDMQGTAKARGLPTTMPFGLTPGPDTVPAPVHHPGLPPGHTTKAWRPWASLVQICLSPSLLGGHRTPWEPWPP